MARNYVAGKGSVSGFRGVRRASDGKWQARIGDDGLRVTLGFFDTPEEAAHVHDDEARRLRGRDAITNFS